LTTVLITEKTTHKGIVDTKVTVWTVSVLQGGTRSMWSAELLAARLVLGVIFLFSGVGKALSSRALVDVIMDYRLLSRRQARIAAPLLPVGEIVLGGLCIVGVGLPIAASLIALLLLVFTMAIAINLARGRRFACNCFGDSKMAIGPAALLRNSLLLVLAVFVAVRSLPLHSLAMTGVQWQQDSRMFLTLDTLAPLAAAVLLLLSAILLLGEVDVLFSTPSHSKELW